MNRFNHDKEIDIYRRILRYPPFLLRRQPGPMRIEYSLPNGGKVVTHCSEAITTEDGEKLFAVMYLASQYGVKEWACDGIEVVVSSFPIRELRQITNCHDDQYLITTLRKLRGLTITYIFPDGQRAVLGIIHEVKWDHNTISVLLNQKFYELCTRKKLTISFSLYQRLSPTAKNLYLFLSSSPNSKLELNTLVQRIGIQCTRPDNIRTKLIRALRELVRHGYLVRFYVHDGQLYIQKAPAHSKNYFIHSGRKPHPQR